MEKQIVKLTKLMESNLIMLAIRHALTITIPVLMIGSIACLLKSLPIEVYQSFITGFADGLLYKFFSIIHSACFDFFSIFVVINVSICYMMEYTGAIGDLMTIPAVALAGFFILSGAGTADFNVAALSVNNTFTAVLSSVSICVVLRHIQTLGNGKIKTGTSGGLLYHKAINMIIPAIIVLMGCGVAMLLFRAVTQENNLLDLMTKIGNSVVNLTDNNFIKGVTYLFIVQISWFFGLHGGNIMESVVRANFMEVLPTEVFNKTFFDTYVNMGGCGTAICIVIAIFICSKHETSRNVAKGAILPIICNINELVTFGLPIVFNPIMGIPFLLVPLANYSLAYIATAMNIVPHVIQRVEWTTPVFISGYCSTGTIAGALLQLVCIVTGVLIYMPFIKIHERVFDDMFKTRVDGLTELLIEHQLNNSAPHFLRRKDVYEATAKTLIFELEQAIKNRELFMMYQPQVDTNGKCIGAEALLRWKHPIAGFIYPPLIIELAKEGKLLAQLEHFIFDEACRMAKRASKYLGDDMKISVNITATSLKRNTIAEEIDIAAERHQLSPRCIWVEITENDVLSDTEDVVAKLRRLKDSGHKLLIDDFSMGNTSLKYLKTECFDGIKLDAAITKNVKNDKVGQEIIAVLSDLGKRLDIKLMAEYVEDESQKKVLQDLGCNFYQGYLYSKPLEENEFIEYIKQ